jgi:catechol 2,3-dioxygenase-like lactoylglutathione lyase family enzyme
MANSFGTDIQIHAEDAKAAAAFYVEQLGFRIEEETETLITIRGPHINLYIEPGPKLGPVLEVTVPNVEAAKQNLVAAGCEIVKDEPNFPRTYIRDPFGLIYNLTT